MKPGAQPQPKIMEFTVTPIQVVNSHHSFCYCQELLWLVRTKPQAEEAVSGERARKWFSRSTACRQKLAGAGAFTVKAVYKGGSCA